MEYGLIQYTFALLFIFITVCYYITIYGRVTLHKNFFSVITDMLFYSLRNELIEGSEPESRMSEHIILRKANLKICYRLNFHLLSGKQL